MGSDYPRECNGTSTFDATLKVGGNPPINLGPPRDGRGDRIIAIDPGPRKGEACSSREGESAYGACRITARHVRGLQIGTGNEQFNTYEYEVERPNIDFATVLSRADVREALKALSADPDNSDLQRNADRSLASGPMFREQPKLCVEQSEMSSDQQARVFDAFIFVENCTGVQVGDDATQKNRFLYVVAPTLDAAQLLADDPSVRSAIIDCVCSTNEDGSEDVLKDELAAALEAAVLNSPDIRTAGDSISLPTHGRVDIANKDGVQVGRQGQQQNNACAMVVIPGAVVKSMREERITVEKLREQHDEASGTLGGFGHSPKPYKPHKQGDSCPGFTHDNEQRSTAPGRDEAVLKDIVHKIFPLPPVNKSHPLVSKSQSRTEPAPGYTDMEME